jgi:dTDP-4-dehydrorhamnose reductase
MRIVVTGGSGMLGHCLMRLARRRHEVWGSYHTHPVEIPGCSLFAMDVTHESEVRAQLEAVKPDVVVHTAALTDVDECERSPEKAKRINSEGTRITAKISQELGAQLVYISSDYVFNGAHGTYSETDAPDPVNCYGESKLSAEEYAQQLCSRLLIVRTTMFGLKLPPRIGLMESLIDALRRGRPLTRFVDQYFTPLYTGQFSEIVLRLVEIGATGLFHIGAAEKVSRFEFAQEVAEIFAPRCSEIRPVPFQQIDGLARRPKDTSLISRAVQERLGIPLPDFRAGLRQLQHDWLQLSEEGLATP